MTGGGGVGLSAPARDTGGLCINWTSPSQLELSSRWRPRRAKSWYRVTHSIGAPSGSTRTRWVARRGVPRRGAARPASAAARPFAAAAAPARPRGVAGGRAARPTSLPQPPPLPVAAHPLEGATCVPHWQTAPPRAGGVRHRGASRAALRGCPPARGVRDACVGPGGGLAPPATGRRHNGPPTGQRGITPPAGSHVGGGGNRGGPRHLGLPRCCVFGVGARGATGNATDVHVLMGADTVDPMVVTAFQPNASSLISQSVAAG